MTKVMEKIKKMSDTDLHEEIASKREELRKLRFNLAGAGSKNTKAQRNLKTEIARLLTESNSRNK